MGKYLNVGNAGFESARLIRNSDLLLEQTLAMNEEAVASIIEEVHSRGDHVVK